MSGSIIIHERIGVQIIDRLTVLICLAALFSYLNHRLLKLPIKSPQVGRIIEDGRQDSCGLTRAS
ncbi:MAG: hypothetical protein ABI980_08695 [Nitrospirota bacterium]